MYIHIMINWQLSKKGTPHDCIAGSSVQLIEEKCFLGRYFMYGILYRFYLINL